jgi:hypothetical protein
LPSEGIKVVLGSWLVSKTVSYLFKKNPKNSEPDF